MMKKIFILILLVTLVACNNTSKENSTIENITSNTEEIIEEVPEQTNEINTGEYVFKVEPEEEVSKEVLDNIYSGEGKYRYYISINAQDNGLPEYDKTEETLNEFYHLYKTKQYSSLCNRYNEIVSEYNLTTVSNVELKLIQDSAKEIAALGNDKNMTEIIVFSKTPITYLYNAVYESAFDFDGMKRDADNFNNYAHKDELSMDGEPIYSEFEEITINNVTTLPGEETYNLQFDNSAEVMRSLEKVCEITDEGIRKLYVIDFTYSEGYKTTIYICQFFGNTYHVVHVKNEL